MTTATAIRPGMQVRDEIDLASRRAAAYLGQLRTARRTGMNEPAAERAYATAMRELSHAWDTHFDGLVAQS